MITLTNGVQIPENAVQLQTTAAIDGYYVTQPLRLVQYDETLPVAAVQLTYQNQSYTPPTGAELNVRMGKPDGTTVYNPCLGMDSSGIVYFAFTQQMTIVAGTGTLTVEITDSGVKNSAPIIAEIRPNPVPEGSIESADEFLTLQEILAEAEKWGQIVQTNAANIQQVVDNLEDIQNAAENAQAAAASAEAAQQAAQEALGFRTFFSAVRPDENGNLDPSRPMTVGPAASVEIESAGDRIQSVTALGFTQQAGTGDPSPTNVRAITNGGLKLIKLVLDGTENWAVSVVSGDLYKRFYAPLSIAAPSDWKSTVCCTDFIPKSIIQESPINGIGTYSGKLYLRWDEYNNSVEALKADLAARYAAGDPVIVWYVPADESQATGLYAPIILTSGEYRATCLPLTAPLCEGDSVVSWVKSGCDQVITLTGANVRAVSGNAVYFGIDSGATIDNSPTLGAGFAICDNTFQFISTTYWAGLKAREFTYGNGQIGVYDAVNTTNELAQEYYNAHPLTVWYRSTNYTEAADIPVSLETHQQAVLVLDGTETFSLAASPANMFQTYSLVNGKNFTAVSDQYKNGGNQWNSMPDFSVLNSGVILGFRDSRFSTAEDFKAELAAQYAAGTPVTIVYQLATPIIYAHEAVVLEAATGEQLTYTVTGQSGGTVSVTLKPFQDGGHAKTADNAQLLDGLTLLAIKESMIPVGYIFSWAPVDDGPDLSTPAKVAEYFGFGTWQAYGTGQVLVGVDSGQTEFATPGKTGGEKTHQLTTAELAKHSHKMYWSNEGGTGTGNGVLVRDALSGGPWPYGYFTETDGGNQPHNNLQPYVVVYRWQRIA